MGRREQHGQNGTGGIPVPMSRGKKALRTVMTLVICALAALFYTLWLRQTKEAAMPPMVMPQPYFYEEEQPVRAVLLWREKVLKAPVSGPVQLAHGGKPAVAARGDVLGTVLSRGKSVPVLSPERGYFVPATDGAENDWEYSRLWPGSGLLPEAPELKWTRNLAPLGADLMMGKLIFMPQKPRAIFYLNLTESLEKELQRGTIMIRKESKGSKWAAHVRVYIKLSGQKAKVALDMPYFPLDMALSREALFFVCAAEDSGLVVPESSVILRDGAYGVFELIGDKLTFREITGKPVKDGMFFVATGLSHGNPVILHAADAEERRVQLW